MYVMVIIVLLYAFLICFDLIPVIKKKEKKALFLSIPVYILTLVINIMTGLGFNFPPINDMITQMITSIFHMQ
jgi:hypothetical protein